MTTTVEYVTRTIDGKDYELKITRQKGLQEIMIDGKLTLVEEAEYIKWPRNMGTSQCYTVARPEKTQIELAAALDRVRETATNGLLIQGIW